MDIIDDYITDKIITNNDLNNKEKEIVLKSLFNDINIYVLDNTLTDEEIESFVYFINKNKIINDKIKNYKNFFLSDFHENYVLNIIEKIKNEKTKLTIEYENFNYYDDIYGYYDNRISDDIDDFVNSEKDILDNFYKSDIDIRIKDIVTEELQINKYDLDIKIKNIQFNNKLCGDVINSQKKLLDGNKKNFDKYIDSVNSKKIIEDLNTFDIVISKKINEDNIISLIKTDEHNEAKFCLFGDFLIQYDKDDEITEDVDYIFENYLIDDIDNKNEKKETEELNVIDKDLYETFRSRIDKEEYLKLLAIEKSEVDESDVLGGDEKGKTLYLIKTRFDEIKKLVLTDIIKVLDSADENNYLQKSLETTTEPKPSEPTTEIKSSEITMKLEFNLNSDNLVDIVINNLNTGYNITYKTDDTNTIKQFFKEKYEGPNEILKSLLSKLEEIKNTCVESVSEIYKKTIEKYEKEMDKLYENFDYTYNTVYDVERHSINRDLFNEEFQNIKTSFNTFEENFTELVYVSINNLSVENPFSLIIQKNYNDSFNELQKIYDRFDKNYEEQLNNEKNIQEILRNKTIFKSTMDRVEEFNDFNRDNFLKIVVYDFTIFFYYMLDVNPFVDEIKRYFGKNLIKSLMLFIYGKYFSDILDIKYVHKNIKEIFDNVATDESSLIANYTTFYNLSSNPNSDKIEITASFNKFFDEINFVIKKIYTYDSSIIEHNYYDQELKKFDIVYFEAIIKEIFKISNVLDILIKIHESKFDFIDNILDNEDKITNDEFKILCQKIISVNVKIVKDFYEYLETINTEIATYRFYYDFVFDFLSTGRKDDTKIDADYFKKYSGFIITSLKEKFMINFNIFKNYCETSKYFESITTRKNDIIDANGDIKDKMLLNIFDFYITYIQLFNSLSFNGSIYNGKADMFFIKSEVFSILNLFMTYFEANLNTLFFEDFKDNIIEESKDFSKLKLTTEENVVKCLFAYKNFFECFNDLIYCDDKYLKIKKLIGKIYGLKEKYSKQTDRLKDKHYESLTKQLDNLNDIKLETLSGNFGEINGLFRKIIEGIENLIESYVITEEIIIEESRIKITNEFFIQKINDEIKVSIKEINDRVEQLGKETEKYYNIIELIVTEINSVMFPNNEATEEKKEEETKTEESTEEKKEENHGANSGADNTATSGNNSSSEMFGGFRKQNELNYKTLSDIQKGGLHKFELNDAEEKINKFEEKQTLKDLMFDNLEIKNIIELYEEIDVNEIKILINNILKSYDDILYTHSSFLNNDKFNIEDIEKINDKIYKLRNCDYFRSKNSYILNILQIVGNVAGRIYQNNYVYNLSNVIGMIKSQQLEYKNITLYDIEREIDRKHIREMTDYKKYVNNQMNSDIFKEIITIENCINIFYELYYDNSIYFSDDDSYGDKDVKENLKILLDVFNFKNDKDKNIFYNFYDNNSNLYYEKTETDTKSSKDITTNEKSHITNLYEFLLLFKDFIHVLKFNNNDDLTFKAKINCIQNTFDINLDIISKKLQELKYLINDFKYDKAKVIKDLGAVKDVNNLIIDMKNSLKNPVDNPNEQIKNIQILKRFKLYNGERSLKDEIDYYYKNNYESYCLDITNQEKLNESIDYIISLKDKDFTDIIDTSNEYQKTTKNIFIDIIKNIQRINKELIQLEKKSLYDNKMEFMGLFKRLFNDNVLRYFGFYTIFDHYEKKDFNMTIIKSLDRIWKYMLYLFFYFTTENNEGQRIIDIRSNIETFITLFFTDYDSNTIDDDVISDEDKIYNDINRDNLLLLKDILTNSTVFTNAGVNSAIDTISKKLYLPLHNTLKTILLVINNLKYNVAKLNELIETSKDTSFVSQTTSLATDFLNNVSNIHNKNILLIQILSCIDYFNDTFDVSEGITNILQDYNYLIKEGIDKLDKNPFSIILYPNLQFDDDRNKIVMDVLENNFNIFLDNKIFKINKERDVMKHLKDYSFYKNDMLNFMSYNISLMINIGNYIFKEKDTESFKKFTIFYNYLYLIYNNIPSVKNIGIVENIKKSKDLILGYGTLNDKIKFLKDILEKILHVVISNDYWSQVDLNYLNMQNPLDITLFENIVDDKIIFKNFQDKDCIVNILKLLYLLSSILEINTEDINNIKNIIFLCIYLFKHLINNLSQNLSNVYSKDFIISLTKILNGVYDLLKIYLGYYGFEDIYCKLYIPNDSIDCKIFIDQFKEKLNNYDTFYYIKKLYDKQLKIDDSLYRDFKDSIIRLSVFDVAASDKNYYIKYGNIIDYSVNYIKNVFLDSDINNDNSDSLKYLYNILIYYYKNYKKLINNYYSIEYMIFMIYKTLNIEFLADCKDIILDDILRDNYDGIFTNVTKEDYEIFKCPDIDDTMGVIVNPFTDQRLRLDIQNSYFDKEEISREFFDKYEIVDNFQINYKKKEEGKATVMYGGGIELKSINKDKEYIEKIKQKINEEIEKLNTMEDLKKILEVYSDHEFKFYYLDTVILKQLNFVSKDYYLINDDKEKTVRGLIKKINEKIKSIKDKERNYNSYIEEINITKNNLLEIINDDKNLYKIDFKNEINKALFDLNIQFKNIEEKHSVDEVNTKNTSSILTLFRTIFENQTSVRQNRETQEFYNKLKDLLHNTEDSKNKFSNIINQLFINDFTSNRIGKSFNQDEIKMVNVQRQISESLSSLINNKKLHKNEYFIASNTKEVKDAFIYLLVDFKNEETKLLVKVLGLNPMTKNKEIFKFDANDLTNETTKFFSNCDIVNFKVEETPEKGKREAIKVGKYTLYNN